MDSLERTYESGDLTNRREHLRPILFFFVFLVGLILIIYGASLPSRRGLVEIILAFLMVMYMAAGLSSGTFRGREEELGDNLYYLGFLFTLVSLAVALYTLNVLDQGTSIAAALLRNFGIALVTTIAGMVLRLLMYQLHRPHSEEDSLVRLAKAADTAAMELNRSAEDIKLSHGRIIDSLDDTLKRSAGGAADAVEEAGRRMQQASQASVAGMQQSLDGFRGRIDGIGTAAGEVAKTLDDLGARVSKVDIPTDLITKKIAPLADGIGAHLSTVAATAKAAADANNHLSGVLGQLEIGASRTTAAMDGLARVGERFGAISPILEQICKQLDAIADKLKNASERIVVGASASADTLTDLAKRASADTEIAARHRNELDSELRRARTTVGDLSEALRPMTAALRDRAETEAKHAAMYGEVLKAEVKRAEELNQELHDKAISIIEFISKNIPA